MTKFILSIVLLLSTACLDIKPIEIGWHTKAVRWIENDLNINSNDCSTFGETTTCENYTWTFTRETNAITEVVVYEIIDNNQYELLYHLRCDLKPCHIYDPENPDTSWSLK